MALLPLLDVARSGLPAHDFGRSLTGSPTPRASTPSYPQRRSRVADASVELDVGDVAIRRGVSGAGAERIVDETVDRLLERRRRLATTEASGHATRRDALAALADVETERGSALAAALDAFFDAADALEHNPAGIVERQQLLGGAAALTGELARRATAIAGEQRALDGRTVVAVWRANAALERLAALDGEIARAAAGIADVLRDERARVLDELAAVLPVDVLVRAESTLTVAGGDGLALVDGGRVVRTLALDAGDAGLDGRPLAGPAESTAAVTKRGMLCGLLTARDRDAVVVAWNLDEFAAVLAGAVNAVQNDPGALDLDGLPTADAPLLAGTTATTLAVAIADPRRIAASRSDDSPMRALSELRRARHAALGDLDFGAWLSAEERRLAADAARADDAAIASALLATQADAHRAVLAGAGLDEQLARLVQVQRAVQAAAKLPGIAGRLLDELEAPPMGRHGRSPTC